MPLTLNHAINSHMLQTNLLKLYQHDPLSQILPVISELATQQVTQKVFYIFIKLVINNFFQTLSITIVKHWHIIGFITRVRFLYTGVISYSFKESGNLLFLMALLILLVRSKKQVSLFLRKFIYFLVHLLESIQLLHYLRTSFSRFF